jgi:hypothetical protein
VPHGAGSGSSAAHEQPNLRTSRWVDTSQQKLDYYVGASWSSADTMWLVSGLCGWSQDCVGKEATSTT